MDPSQQQSSRKRKQQSQPSQQRTQPTPQAKPSTKPTSQGHEGAQPSHPSQQPQEQNRVCIAVGTYDKFVYGLEVISLAERAERERQRQEAEDEQEIAEDSDSLGSEPDDFVDDDKEDGEDVDGEDSDLANEDINGAGDVSNDNNADEDDIDKVKQEPSEQEDHEKTPKARVIQDGFKLIQDIEKEIQLELTRNKKELTQSSSSSAKAGNAIENQIQTADTITTSPMKTIFACEAHDGCVRVLAASGKWMASGGTDQLIQSVFSWHVFVLVMLTIMWPCYGIILLQDDVFFS